jgi:molecular chaperone DnaJ
VSDPYKVLGIPKSASVDDIKKAYRKLAMQHHPDQNQGDASAEEKFKEVSNAYGILGDEHKRAEYDSYGHSGGRRRQRNPFEGMHHPFGSGIFEEFFGTRRRRPSNPRGRDIGVHLSVSFLEAAHGTNKLLKIKRNIPCDPCGSAGGTGLKDCVTCLGTGMISINHGIMVIQTVCNICSGTGQMVKDVCSTCHGSGDIEKESEVRVKVPSGIMPEGQLRLQGLGHHGKGGSGDLFVKILVEPHPNFQREGNDVHSEEGVTISDVLLGCTRAIETVHGEMSVDILAGSPTNSILVLEGCGIPAVNGTHRGNHCLHLKVDIPSHLTPEQAKTVATLKSLGL